MKRKNPALKRLLALVMSAALVLGLVDMAVTMYHSGSDKALGAEATEDAVLTDGTDAGQAESGDGSDAALAEGEVTDDATTVSELDAGVDGDAVDMSDGDETADAAGVTDVDDAGDADSGFDIGDAGDADSGSDIGDAGGAAGDVDMDDASDADGVLDIDDAGSAAAVSDMGKISDSDDEADATEASDASDTDMDETGDAASETDDSSGTTEGVVGPGDEFFGGEGEVHNVDVFDGEGDELFEEYLDKLIYGDNGISTVANWGYTYYADNESNLAFYKYLREKGAAVANGDLDTAYFTPYDDEGICWTYTYDELGFDEPVQNANYGYLDLYDAGLEKFKEDIMSSYGLYYMLFTVMYDCPYEYYWFDKTRGYGYSYNYKCTSSDNYETLDTISLYFPAFYLCVSGEFLPANATYYYQFDTSYVQTAKASIANADAIVEKYKNYSDYEKLLAYKDEICALTSYNDDAAEGNYSYDYGNPWQLIWIFDGDSTTNVVCEGYSKAFQYLCDKSTFSGDVVCYTVIGYLGSSYGGSPGGHMWNIVHIDGDNYLVDVTNSDAGMAGYNGSLFLVAPYSGSYDGSYFFHASYNSSNYVYYQYDTGTFGIYPESVLKLASSSYTPPTVSAQLSLPDDGYVYDGTEKKPDVIVRSPSAGTALTEGTDYEISGYSDNIYPGTASVTVSFIGSYAGESDITLDFEIGKGVLTPEIFGNLEKVYDGTTDAGADVYISLDGLASGDDVTATATSISYDEKNVGSRTITASGIGISGDDADYYTLASKTATAEGSISPKELTASIEGTATKDYDGTTAVVGDDLSISLSGVVDGDDVTAKAASYEYGTPTAGTQTVTAYGVELGGDDADNYTLASGDVTGIGFIAAIGIAEENVSGVEDVYYYTGEAIVPEMMITVGGNTLVEEQDYTINIDGDNTGVGTVLITIVGCGNYTGTVEKEFTISYIPTPEYTVDGTPGDNGWYVSPVGIYAMGWVVSEDGIDWEEKLEISTEGETSHTFYFKEEGSGYITDAVYETVKIDTVGPDFSSANSGLKIKDGSWYQTLLSIITFGLYYNDDPLTATINATDGVSGIAAYYYYVDNSGDTTAKTAGELAGVEFTETTDKSFTLTEEGDYVIYAYAVDVAGNESDYICSEGFIIDRTPMVVSASMGSGDTTVQVNLFSDEAGTIYYLLTDEEITDITPDYVVENYTDETCANGAGELTVWLYNLHGDHTYYLYLVGVDLAGNVGECVSKEFTTDYISVKVTVSPTLSGYYGTCVEDMDITGGSVEDTYGNEVTGVWKITDENASDIPTVGTTDQYQLTFYPDDEEHDTATWYVTPDVSYIDPPSYTLEGDTDDTGWYVTRVTITPDEGWQISMDGETWEDVLTLSQNGSNELSLYFKQIETGYITDAVPETVNIAIAIETALGEAPTLSGIYGTAVKDMDIDGGVVTAEDTWSVEGEWRVSDANGSDIPVVGTLAEYELTFTPTDTSYSELVIMVVPTVTQATLTPSISGSASKTYDGGTAVEEGSLSINLSGIVGDDDVSAKATFEYGSADVGENIIVTTRDITLTGSAAGNYVLDTTELETTGIITAKDIASDGIEIGEIMDRYYTGAALEQDPVVRDNGIGATLVEGEDYELAYTDNVDVGEATVTIRGMGNYDGSMDAKFTISYIDVPNYNVSGSIGDNGWYASQVTISATGWSVSEDGSSWAETLTIDSEGTTTQTLYFKQDDTGYITAATTETVYIDSVSPGFISETEGINIKDSPTWYQKLLTIITFGLYNYNDDSVKVTIAATDATSGIAAYYYYVDESGSTTAKTAEELAEVEFTETTDKTFTLTEEGDYVVYAYVVDKAGNMSDYICSDGFTIDRTAMERKLTVQSGDIYAALNITTSEAGTIYYIITDAYNHSYFDNLLTEGTTVSVDDSCKATVDLTGLSGGTTYYIFYKGVDQAGNVGSGSYTSFMTKLISVSVTEAPAIGGVYGTAVEDMTPTGGVVMDAYDNEVDGTWAVTDGNASDIPKVGTATTYELTFTPNDTEHESIGVNVTPTITPATLTATLNGTASKTYDGTTAVAEGDLSITLEGIIGNDDVSATATYEYGSADVGENITVTARDITLTGSAAGNYVLSTTELETTGTITAKDIGTATVTLDEIIMYYTGEARETGVTLRDAELSTTLIKGVDYELTYTDNVEVGEATVTIRGIGNYDGSVEAKFTISYIDTPNYDVSGTVGDDGWYTSQVTISATGWSVSADGSSWDTSLTIDTEGTTTQTLYFKQDGTGYITESTTETVYIDSASPAFTSATEGINIQDGPTWYQTLLKIITFGLYNYNDDSVKVTISASDATSGIAAYYYYVDESGSTTAMTAEDLAEVKFTETDTPTFNLTGEGDYVIYAYVVDKAGNMSDYICSEGFTIDRTAMEITLNNDATTVLDASFTLGVDLSEPGTITCVITDTAIENVTADDILENSEAQTLTVTDGDLPTVTIDFTDVHANHNYYVYVVGTDATGNVSGVLIYECKTYSLVPTITEAPTLTGVYGTAVEDMAITGGKAIDKGSDVEVDGTWSVTDSDKTDVPGVDGTKAYVVTFTSYDDEHAQVTAEVVPAVTPKPINVTADDATKVYGEANPTFTYTVETGALVGDDTAESLGVTLATTATETSDVGDYAITGTAKGNANYDVTVVAGTLTITQAEQPENTPTPETGKDEAVIDVTDVMEVDDDVKSKEVNDILPTDWVVDGSKMAEDAIPTLLPGGVYDDIPIVYIGDDKDNYAVTEVVLEIVWPAHIITASTDDEYVIGQDTSATIKCTGDYGLFIEALMDDVAVDGSNYDLAEGSTILTFHEDYLDTLTLGTHTVTMRYPAGDAVSTLLVEQLASAENEGDEDEGTTGADTTEGGTTTGTDTTVDDGTGTTTGGDETYVPVDGRETADTDDGSDGTSADEAGGSDGTLADDAGGSDSTAADEASATEETGSAGDAATASVQTGDASHAALWFMLVCVCGAVAVVAARKRRA